MIIMDIQLSKLFNAYDQLLPIVQKTGYVTSSSSPLYNQYKDLQNIFEAKKKNPDLSIMVYGVYNAGKSTLINALAGAEVAATGDIPLTSQVSEYLCGAFKIIDTPGIDAPIAHEKVTKEQLQKADVIIFVVNPIGVAEEQKTLDALISLVEKQKQVFLVFNEKDKLQHEDFMHLKDQTRIILQDLASQRGLSEVVKEIPIVKINAKTALKGRLENKQTLIDNSGFTDFEKDLNEFIGSLSDKTISQRLKTELEAFVQIISQQITDSSNNEIVRKFDRIILDIGEQKILAKEQLQTIVEKERKELYDQVKSWLRNENPNLESALTQWIQIHSDLTWNRFDSMFEKIRIELKKDIEELEAQLLKLATDYPIVQTPNIDYALSGSVERELQTTQSALNKDNLTSLSQMLSTQVKTEHVISGLNIIKRNLPTLMKGVGQKTIEKWAGQIVGKAIPLASAIIVVGTALHDVFGEDEHTAQLKREQQAYQKARERWEQQIEDNAKDVSNQYATSLLTSLNKVVDEFFNQLISEVNLVSKNFSDEDQINAQYFEQINAVKQTLQV